MWPVVPSFVDEEALAQEVSPKVRYLSWPSLATPFLDSSSLPGHQSDLGHTRKDGRCEVTTDPFLLSVLGIPSSWGS